jgi:lipopolysaccharide biosynthesis glycosyltransferase
VHLTWSTDRAYVPHTAASILSALRRQRDVEPVAHVLHDRSVTSEQLGELDRMIQDEGGEAHFVAVPHELTEGLPGWEYIPPTMWFRVFLPELLPDVSKLLYLDSDTLVMDSLDSLFAVELASDYVGAVSNVFQLDHLGRLDSLSIDDPRDYFNSGVLLMNLDSMRRDATSVKLREFALHNRDDLLWPDQDAFNLVLGPRRKSLHPRWNAMNGLFAWPWSAYVYGVAATAAARAAPSIRHFEGPTTNKPWHFACPWPHRDEYLRARRETPWSSVREVGRTPGRRLTRSARSLARRARARISA